ncbi:MAG TPA: hypothetical protein VLJ19_07985 [Variovorax sp.]|nr:hypothetical protein [Variovorax sp.]
MAASLGPPVAPVAGAAELCTAIPARSAATGAQLATSESSLKLNPIVPYLALTYRF